MLGAVVDNLPVVLETRGSIFKNPEELLDFSVTELSKSLFDLKLGGSRDNISTQSRWCVFVLNTELNL